jgi:hypothetical protein
MRGIQGLVVAIGLGICGALFNWIYLNTRAQQVAMELFVGIRPKTVVERNELLTRDHLVPVPIPREAAGTLREFAVLYSAQQAVIGHAVTRTIPGGSLLLNDDIRTPPLELNLGLGADKEGSVRERAMWIPFDTRSFIPSLITPGDQVSFLMPRPTAPPAASARPAPAKPDAQPTPVPVTAPSANDPAAGTEVLGPFKVLSVGNRLGSVEAFRAARMSQAQESVLTILVNIDTTGQLEPKAQRLWDLVRASNFQRVGVLLHPRKAK